MCTIKLTCYCIRTYGNLLTGGGGEYSACSREFSGTQNKEIAIAGSQTT